MATNTNRPTSPHLQVYKLPLTGIISITHRLTGMLLSAGLILIVYILYAVAGGSSTYSSMQSFMSLWPVKLLYWGFIYALFFHLCHGVRHLIWDSGKSFELDTLKRYALVELGCSLVLTLFTLLLTSE
jgi:succinate dehydrogenase / fumarate reductase cytochrome b subunit